MEYPLEDLKRDLIWQLSFEQVDRNYFKDTLERTIEQDGEWKQIQAEKGKDL